MRKLFLFILLISTQLNAQYFLEGDRAYVDPLLAPFYHGVASGDPLSDRVIIWTRITTSASSATVNWQVSSDTSFAQIIQSGTVQTDASKDYTVKVDVTGLQPNTWYYYRFSNNGIRSITGRTKTTPVTNVANLRFAVLACSNYQSGFFNAYRDIVTKNDVDAVIHLGDYYYEYGHDDFDPGVDSSRLHEPAIEILTLEDYRMRNSFYRLDRDLRALHQNFPFICVWDDHETANDSYIGGAENHDPNTEGSWIQRANDAKKAYFEWIPIRDVYQSIDTIHRTIRFGNLADLILLDTRLEGRQEQIGTSGAAVEDTNRTLLGSNQLQWLKSELSQSTAQWKLLGNQVMMSPLKILGSAVNQDQWDGYPAERTKILSHLQNNNINNTVVLTGDIHTSWGNDIPLSLSNYTASTGAGSVAVEFVCTSVTSGSFITFSVPIGIIQSFNPNIKYAELSKRGYLLLDLTASRAQGDWIYMSNINNRTFTTSVGASWQTNNNENHLVASPSALTPRTNPAIQPEEVYSSVHESTIVIKPLSIHPNPFTDFVHIQYFMYKKGEVKITLNDLTGKIVFEKIISHGTPGLNYDVLDVKKLIPGHYIISIQSDKETYSSHIQK